MLLTFLKLVSKRVFILFLSAFFLFFLFPFKNLTPSLLSGLPSLSPSLSVYRVLSSLVYSSSLSDISLSDVEKLDPFQVFFLTNFYHSLFSFSPFLVYLFLFFSDFKIIGFICELF